MKTLYISDMDGTLLNDGGKVSRRSVEIINELIKNGMLFTVATARSAMSAAELLKDIDISVPAVLMNGVFLFDLKNKKAVAYHEIPKGAFFCDNGNICAKEQITVCLFLRRQRKIHNRIH